MNAPSSILRTLTLGLAASVVGVLLVLGLVTQLLSERALRDIVRDGLEEDALAVLAAVQRQPEGQGFRVDSTLLLPAYQLPLSGRYYTVHVDGQVLRSRSLWDEELPPGLANGVLQALPVSALGEAVMLLQTPYRRHGTELVIEVATDMAPLLSRLRAIAGIVLLLALLATLLILLLQRWWLQRSLRPLVRTQAEVQELQAGRREQLSRTAPRELLPLIDELNRLLRHARDAMARSRHALGNLGHALKSPLGVLFVLAQRAEPELREPMLTELQRMQRRIGRELARARSAGELLSGARFEPQQDLPALLETLQRAHRRPLELHWQAEPGTQPFEQDDMLELLGNLVDNAFKWARSRIDIRVERRGTELWLCVEDDGPGIAAGQREAMLQRGTRLDESVEGHGLGLGIVSDMVALYHGSLALDSSALGGLAVTLRLPLPHEGGGAGPG
jgi:signal transduction histidine kinase